MILLHGTGMPRDASTLFNAVQLFDGFSPGERAAIEMAMTHRLFPAGETILAAGARSDELMLLLQGTASILVRNEQGQTVRLAGVRRGAVIGEVGFLDGSTRSASVVAHNDVLVACLARAEYEALCQSSGVLKAKLLGNLSVALAKRLRHMNQLALARTRT